MWIGCLHVPTGVPGEDNQWLRKSGVLPLRERLRVTNGKSSAHAVCDVAPYWNTGREPSIERTTLRLLRGLVAVLGNLRTKIER